tara:strand:+ start:481 stop:1104 length:624 start_codon:yes stop_codon:yes gene_type:complete
MNNTELINGFGDVMQHIKEQEQRIKELNNKNDSYRKKIDTLVEQKQELEAKVDEAQVAFEENKLYKKEIDTLRESVENECEASGIMEIMNMRIEYADNKAREQEVLKVIAEKGLEREQAMNKCHVEQINRLHDILRDQCDKDCCQYCDEWVNSTEIEEVKDSDYENVYICMDCLQGSFTQCDDCMEYCCDSLIVLQNGQQICSNCSG